MRSTSKHIEWLSLIETSGPFLTVSLLEKAFPQGLEMVETNRRQRVRAAYEEWCDAIDENDPLLQELHYQWIWLVLTQALEYDDYALIKNTELDKSYIFNSSDFNGKFVPDLLIMGEGDDKPRLFISIQDPETDLETAQKNDKCPIPIVERMKMLCRSYNVRLGLITNGERWMLVNAPVGSTSSHASWYSRLWFQEPDTFKAFQSLLGVRRFFGPEEETLSALLEESLEDNEDVTDTLGEQVRRAVEVLVQCLDKADEDRDRELLRDVSPEELYEAGLTVMMRLVFILCAEERGLLLLGDPLYDQYYALSSLRGQLAEDADHFGQEVLDRRHDAWARLLALFRAIYGGIEHESLRMPALGGSLFDPDRFPFLEGRRRGTSWINTDALPLPIDNRTVLLLLNSLQILEQYGGALLLSYRALDVEQIGHVYEGLLEYTVVRVPQVTLSLIGSQKAKNPNISLALLETAYNKGEKEVVTLLKEATQRSDSAIMSALSKSAEDAIFSRLLSVCGGDLILAQRIKPFANLLRTDAWGDPIVYRANAFMVTLGVDRRETGTHYTAKSLTETIVAVTLEPVVYQGAVEGMPREEWRLKNPTQLLNLKICDCAMGSGAFLVQACRWLAERLVESWGIEEAEGKVITIDGEVRKHIDNFDPMSVRIEDRLLIAKRLIAEQCLYGVDINPLAVELAKLSIWLITMAKNCPFGFLDHNLRYGDSMIGIHRLDQLTMMSMNPEEEQQEMRIFGKDIEDRVKEAIEMRMNMRNIPIHDIRDIETMRVLNDEVKKKIGEIELIADAIVGETFRYSGNASKLGPILDSLAMNAGQFLKGSVKTGEVIMKQAHESLSVELPLGRSPRKPFHWSLEFPEVFITQGGFDAVIGNPPFLWGNRISSLLGDKYRDWLLYLHKDMNGNADFCAHFFRRIHDMVNSGCFGLIATNSICQTDNRTSCLAPILGEGSKIIWAISDMAWPGKATIHISIVVIYKGLYQGAAYLDGKSVTGVSSYLNEDITKLDPFILPSQDKKSFKGVDTGGLGFVLNESDMEKIQEGSNESFERVWPMLNGDDFLSDPEQKPSRMIINFSDMTEEEARLYPILFKIVETRVKPYRQTVKSEASRQKWWLYNRPRPALYNTITDLDKVLVNCVVSKYICFGFVSKRIIFTNALNVFAMDKYEDFAVLQSTFHDSWARYYGSTLETRNRYNPTDCFETYAFPESIEELDDIGFRYYKYREELMISKQHGLTDVYNQFHNSEIEEQDIKTLRELHVEMDYAVAKAYGWSDLDLFHDFYETKQGLRFTISEGARIEALDRLLKLNLERYEMETKQVSSCVGKNIKTNKVANASEAMISDSQISIFDIEKL